MREGMLSLYFSEEDWNSLSVLDMRRLSDLVTTLVEKVDAQARVVADDTPEAEGSRKRKRSASPSPSSSIDEHHGETNVLNMRVEQLEHELSKLHHFRSQTTTPAAPLPIATAVESSQELARPAKRMRTERRGGVGRSVATAAGYTTLGAALAWAALAYAL